MGAVDESRFIMSGYLAVFPILVFTFIGELRLILQFFPVQVLLVLLFCCLFIWSVLLFSVVCSWISISRTLPKFLGFGLVHLLVHRA